MLELKSFFWKNDFFFVVVIIFIMKQFLFTALLFFITLSVNAETLQAGVSVEDIPKALFGSWRVSAKLDTTNSYSTFKPQSVDCWNLSRIGDRITLDNPFSGANAEISISNVEGNLVVFSKKSPYGGNKILTDIVHIRIDGNKFTGINTLQLESFSLVDNHLMKTETATYRITGEKIAGESIIE